MGGNIPDVAGEETQKQNPGRQSARDLSRRRLIIGSFGCGILLLAAGLGFLIFSETTGIGSADERIASTTEYHEIHEGLSYSEVKRILGHGGHEVNKDRVHGVETAMYLWLNPDGSNVSAIFRDGILTQKSQVGLE